MVDVLSMLLLVKEALKKKKCIIVTLNGTVSNGSRNCRTFAVVISLSMGRAVRSENDFCDAPAPEVVDLEPYIEEVHTCTVRRCYIYM